MGHPAQLLDLKIENIITKIGKTMKYEAFIFDFDGVIADSVEVKTRAFAKLFTRFGAEIENKVVAHHRSHGGMTRVEKFKYYYAHFLNMELSQTGLNELCQDFSSLVVDDVVSSEGIVGAYDFIEQWHDKIDCFIDSATPDDEIVEIVKKRGLNPFFKEVLGSGQSKADNLKTILLNYNLKKENCIFWGDAHSDYLAATQCQVPFIGIVPNKDAPLLKKAGKVKWYTNFVDMQADPLALIF